VLQNSPTLQEGKGKTQLYDWLLNLAACEIEEILCPPIREKALIEYMTELMTERIEMAKGVDIREKDTQVFIACQRALFKLDSPIISYYLLRKGYPGWSGLPEAQLKDLAVNIYSIWKDIERDLNHPLAEKFYKICEKYDTPYLILGDILSQNPAETGGKFDKPEILEGLIKSAYQARLQKLKSRMSRAAFFSTISIFLTKMLLAFAIEIPFDRYVLGEFNRQSMVFNVLIPPLLMFLLVLSIRLPKKENLDRVILETMKIVYEKEKKDVYLVKPSRRKGIILNLIVFIFYSLTFVVSFGLIIWGLKKLDFGTLSIIIFLMFFSLIAFAGVKIRERARELDITEKRAGFIAFLTDTFSLPFLRVGKWLSNQWTRFNIVVVLITALIDMPFQLFTEFLEHWRTFLKEKKEEIH
jgi:nitrate reductase NapE component